MGAPIDQFYTNQDTATSCLATLLPYLRDPCECVFVEPSAGTGSFLTPLIDTNLSFVAWDVEPKHPLIREADYFADTTQTELRNYAYHQPVVMVGNPPFGYRSQTALDFITYAAAAGVTMVAMILPVSFTKYGVQHHLPPGLKLISSTPVTGFHTLTTSGGMKPYNGVRCVYQIWVNTNTPHHVLTPHATTLPDLRVREKPATTHPDFTLWLYNCTPAAEKYFTYPWEFAVLRQGWEPMYPLFLPQEQLSRRKQWMLIKPHTPQARETLLGLDYNKLSENNTAVRGFGKADLITAYQQIIRNTAAP